MPQCQTLQHHDVCRCYGTIAGQERSDRGYSRVTTIVVPRCSVPRGSSRIPYFLAC
jgi:hypothetical protein